MSLLRFDVFGRHMIVEPTDDGWAAYWAGADGKRRAADIAIPKNLGAEEIRQYLDDLFHEAATAKRPSVRTKIRGQ